MTQDAVYTPHSVLHLTAHMINGSMQARRREGLLVTIDGPPVS